MRIYCLILWTTGFVLYIKLWWYLMLRYRVTKVWKTWSHRSLTHAHSTSTSYMVTVEFKTKLKGYLYMYLNYLKVCCALLLLLVLIVMMAVMMAVTFLPSSLIYYHSDWWTTTVRMLVFPLPSYCWNEHWNRSWHDGMQHITFLCMTRKVNQQEFGISSKFALWGRRRLPLMLESKCFDPN